MFLEPRTEIAPRLAAEPGAAYVASPPGQPVVGPTSRLLDDVAVLADQRDRLMGQLVRRLVTVSAVGDLAELTGGMSLHVWLQHQARCTRGEARDVLGAVDMLRAMPATLAGLADRWLSWSQALAITKAARRVTLVRRAELDDLVATAMLAHRDWEPDALVADVWDWVDSMQPSRLEKAEAAAERDRFVTLQPRLFGGGSLYGEFDPVGFATIAEALDAPLGPPVAVPDDLDDPDAVDAAFDELDERRRALTRGHGRALADRLVALCARDLAGTDGSRGSADGPGGASRARPLVVATIDLEALLDQNRTPGWLLHTLAGGRMKVTASTLQRLVDERGADLRTIVLDETGQAVGVGTKTQVPPAWLRQATWARDLAVRDPDGSTPVRRADLDHTIPWPDGRTDLDNLSPLGRTWHNRKTSKAWTVHRAQDGTTTWRHRRHGWTLRLAPPRRDLTDVPDPGPPRLPLDDLDLDDLHEPAPA